MADEQRRHSRFECYGVAQVFFTPGKPPVTARIADLSLSGALVELEDPQANTSGATIEVAFTVNQLPFRVRAHVRAVRSSTRIGLLFENVSGRVKMHLEDLIEELAENKKKLQGGKHKTAADTKG